MRLLRAELGQLSEAVGPTFTHAALAEHAARLGGRLSRTTLIELRRDDSTRLPLWSTVRIFVLAALDYADERAITIPSRLRDLEHWGRLHEACRALRITASNVVVGTVAGGAVMQARDIRGNVQVHVGPPPGPVVRSAYVEQVMRIAPERLYDRDGELAELADWCVRADQQPAYLWWRAPAWAGKSALLSWFVLHPPAGVRMVSFFVTARLSGQGDKRAFAEVVLEQLAQLCGQPLPELLTDATRDAHLLALLAEAATICQRDGERLVLVVDGLDEDRGVTAGPDAHSIAALLPVRPPGGMRVVVAGRPDPPIPADVPLGHPLRDPRIVRELRRSAFAEVVRHDAQRELSQLLHGTVVEQDLLGLVTAAGGGLSGSDLAELTGSVAWEIEELLGAVTGRTFSRRAAGSGPLTAPPVYLLAHEQLQQDATRMLGPVRLSGYRQRLHQWARAYRDRRWPVGTPDYLLRGYHRLLRETNEIALLVDAGLDRARHTRMLDLTGGDTAALAEVTAAQDVVHDQPALDFTAATRLAIYRSEILDRNFLMPANLPEAWAQLGHYARAETLARMLPDPVQQTRALAAVARVAASDAGTVVRRKRRIDDAAWQAVSFSARQSRPRRRRAGVQFGDVEEAISVGDLRRAEELALRIRQPGQRRRATLAVVRATAPGDGAWAERIARRIDSPRWLAHALTELVVPAAAAGDRGRAEELAAEAEKLARIGIPTHRLEVIADIVTAMTTAGDTVAAERLARALDSPRDRAHVLANVVAAVVASGDIDRAQIAAGDIADPAWRATALVGVVRAAGQAGAAATVVARMSARTGTALRAVTSLHEQDRLMAQWAGALAYTDPMGAAALVAAIHEEHARQSALVGLVAVLAENGRVERARDLVESIKHREQREQALPAVAGAVARSGDLTRAVAICRAIDDPRWRVRALLAAGTGANAHALVTEAESVLTQIGYTAQRAQAQTEVIDALAKAGEIGRAETLAEDIAVAYWRSRALGTVVDALLASGARDRAHELANRIPDLDLRARAVVGLALTGDRAEGHRLVANALRSGRWRAALPVLAVLEPEVVRAVGGDFLAALNPPDDHRLIGVPIVRLIQYVI